MTEPPFGRLGIVGLGLIGGSIAMRARANWPAMSITALDTGGRAVEAVRRGIVNAAVGELSEIAAVDLLVLAVPIDSMAPLIRRLAAVSPAAVVTDVGSTKRAVMQAAADTSLRSFIGGHPMAGAEVGGLEHARAELFTDRTWWLVRGRGSAADEARVQAFVETLGARPHWSDAENHDRVVAYVSHLPQLLATTLMNVANERVGEAGIAAAGPAFADMTRLASSPGHLWTGIFEQNGDLIADAVSALIARLPDEHALRDAAWVRTAFDAAAGARTGWLQHARSPRTRENGQ